MMQIEFKGYKTLVTINGNTTEHKTAFLNSLSFKDAITYIKDKNDTDRRASKG